MVDKGERGVKILKKWVMSFMDGPKDDFSSGATFFYLLYPHQHRGKCNEKSALGFGTY